MRHQNLGRTVRLLRRATLRAKGRHDRDQAEQELESLAYLHGRVEHVRATEEGAPATQLRSRRGHARRRRAGDPSL